MKDTKSDRQLRSLLGEIERIVPAGDLSDFHSERHGRIRELVANISPKIALGLGRRLGTLVDLFGRTGIPRIDAEDKAIGASIYLWTTTTAGVTRAFMAGFVPMYERRLRAIANPNPHGSTVYNAFTETIRPRKNPSA